jgi:hypothetical protein
MINYHDLDFVLVRGLFKWQDVGVAVDVREE